MKKIVNNTLGYVRRLCDSRDPTSMTRFLSFHVVMTTLIGWIINSAWLGYMVTIPESVLIFNALVVGAKGIKDIWGNKCPKPLDNS